MPSKQRIKVAVLMGGRTQEHEISLISGSEVVKNLDKKKYEVLPTIISRNGNTWQTVAVEKLLASVDPLRLKGTGRELIKKGEKNIKSIRQLSDMVDVVFIAMHGTNGEDGTIQGMLELAGIRYTGPGVLASALGMDKYRFRKILEADKIRVPKHLAFNKQDPIENIYKYLNGPEYFVKPNNQGSSVGITLVKDRRDLEKAVNIAFEYSNIALVDEYIKGLEVTCGVIGNEDPIALPLVEIHPLKSEFFDYESKYTESGAKEIVPARISKGLTKKVKDISLKVYKLLGCRGFSRIDFILRDNKTPYVLEINTIPGLTPMSLLPKAAAAQGFTYPKLLDQIINYSMN